MKKILQLIICMPLLLLWSCAVHEWPQTPEYVKLHLTLNFETQMTEWIHHYDGKKVVEQGLGKSYDNSQEIGQMRYIVRLYPISDKQRTIQECTHEFVFTKDITQGYNHEVMVDVLPGNYNLMVWSDLVSTADDEPLHDAEDFAGIMLQGEHRANTDYRDAFCGKSSVVLSAKDGYQVYETLTINMKRPLAKFEIQSNDLREFVEMTGRDINLYKAKIQYVGYMPDTYSMLAERPVASETGEVFEFSFIELSDEAISMGSDYVFVSEEGTSVTVKIGLYDIEDKPVSFSEPIIIPLKADHHTLLMGKFLMQNTSNGVDIDPNWGGDYNITL